MALEKRVTYTTSASYSTLNTLSESTKNIWLVFHGMGYLSKYFVRYFSELNAEKNYIIAPQAPSKYYQGPDFKHVGASWLTREDTINETKNVLAYIDTVWEKENPPQHLNFIILGYSQGVSIATRWMSSRQIQCNKLLLHSGGIPKELIHEDFTYLDPKTTVTLLYGTNDMYINDMRKTEETLKATNLFGDRLEIQVFEGGHEVNVEFLQNQD